MDAIRKSDQTISVKRREYNSAKKAGSSEQKVSAKPEGSSMKGLDALGAMGQADVVMAKSKLKFSPQDLNKIAVVARQEDLSREQINDFKKFTLDLMEEKGFDTLADVHEWFNSEKTDPNEIACVISELDNLLDKDVLVDGGFMGYPFCCESCHEE